MTDTRKAQSWRSVRVAQEQLRHEAELRVPPNVELGVVKMSLLLMAFIAVGWWFFG